MKVSPTSPLVLAAMCAALGSWSTPSAAQMAPPVSEQSARRELIASGELRESTALNAYDLVARHRPIWLRPRGTSSFALSNQVTVYLDGMPYGGPEMLRQINTNSIKSIRFMDGVTATNRLGTGHGNGVIWIESR